MNPRRARAALLGAAVVAWSSLLRASPPPSALELVYEVDPALDNCPSGADFRRAIEQRLGTEPFTSSAALKIIARMSASSRGIDGVVTWLGARGASSSARRFATTSHDCEDLARAMEFAITVQIELSAMATPAASPTPTERSGRERPSPTRPPASLPADADRQNVRGAPAAGAERVGASSQVFVGGGPLIGWGTSPGPAPGGRVFAALRVDALSLELGTEVNVPPAWRDDDGRGFRARALIGTLAACGHVSAVSFCGVGKAGGLHVRGLGVDETASSAGAFVQLGARVTGSRWLGEQVLGSVHGELLGTPSRWTVELNRLAVWTMPSVAASIGMELSVPLL